MCVPVSVTPRVKMGESRAQAGRSWDGTGRCYAGDCLHATMRGLSRGQGSTSYKVYHKNLIFS